MSMASHLSGNTQAFNLTPGSSRINNDDIFLKYTMNLVIWFISFNLSELLHRVKWGKL